MRVCTHCKIEKNEEAFHWDKRRNAPRSWCKHCTIHFYDNKPERKEARRQIANRRNARLRIEALEYYSNGLMKCNCCGESQERFLTIDHIDNSGAEHRRKVGRGGVLRNLKKEGYPKGFRVLCFNCNCGREYNKGVCPHEEM